MKLPWLAHLYTALGAVLALYATLAIVEGAFRDAFLALAAATFVDTTDGWLARALRVKERLPGFDGGRLDDIVDYLTYVFVPALLMLEAGLLPVGWGTAACAAVLLSSAYGFGQVDAKVATTDHFFTGFPSYWNIVALYMYVWRLAPAVNAAILVGLAVLVFVPIRYVYPSRTTTLRVPTLLLGAAWGAVVIVVTWRLPATDGPWTVLSLVFPTYYFALSFYLHGRER
ncbi:MAG: CDP-diacylglycerol O-phosphatidyltransferase [Acidobacteriota bacterium]|nr:CDP-diacylglycerol O-phosphatidyltransferase [Acidobacteriota bacterium]